jgi:hypothetical protein
LAKMTSLGGKLSLAKMTSLGGKLSLAQMTLLGGKLPAMVCHPTKRVNKAEDLTYLSTNIE